MGTYQNTLNRLAESPKTWAVTGVAGFIGSNLLETLLMAGQRVVGLDNFATGRRQNLTEVEAAVGPERWRQFQFVDGDIRDRAACDRVVAEADFVLHQAALGSVPLSLERPDETHSANVTGFLNILTAARDRQVSRFVYASSCAVYGDDPAAAKTEGQLGRSISPYATSKRMDELYADVFGACYGLTSVGLRYFNVYGRRQDPNGAYAAVIPKWIAAMLAGEEVRIHGDGKTSRDFCAVQDVAQANILAATSELQTGTSAMIRNVGTGVETNLLGLFEAIRDTLGPRVRVKGQLPVFGEFRSGDIRHSRGDISRGRECLGFEPEFDLRRGLADAADWYVEQAMKLRGKASAIA